MRWRSFEISVSKALMRLPRAIAYKTQILNEKSWRHTYDSTLGLPQEMTTFVAIDFETADRGRDSACAMGLIRVENYQIVQRLHFLIQPPRRRFEFSHIHGITWLDVAQQPTFGELWPNITLLLQNADFIAAHNAPFDKDVLYTCCNTYKITKPEQSFICTVQLARRTWNIRPTKLPNVCQYLGIQLKHHQALSDAEACARIVIAAYQNCHRTL